MTPQLDEHILYNVLGDAIVPEDGERAAVHAAAQGIEDLGQGVIVAGRQPRRQHGIRTPHPSDANPARGGRAIVTWDPACERVVQAQLR